MAQINGEKNAASIPESITINGVTYSVRETPELQDFISKVASVEKAKLYTQFETLKTQISQLANVKVESPASSAPLDADKLKAELKEDLLKELLPALEGVVTKVVQPVLSATAATKEAEIQQYRDKLISENEAICIPELVKGGTKEELESALKESVRIRSLYPSPSNPNPEQRVVDPLVQAQLNAQEASFAYTAPEPPVVRRIIPQPVPGYPSPEVNQGSSPKSMTMEEFSKNRENLKQSLESMYGQP